MCRKDIYYTAPDDVIFEELQGLVWKRFLKITENEPNDVKARYLFEKHERIFRIPNSRDNFMYIFGMLDIDGQEEVLLQCSDACVIEILIRLGNASRDYLVTLIRTDDIVGWLKQHLCKVDKKVLKRINKFIKK